MQLDETLQRTEQQTRRKTSLAMVELFGFIIEAKKVHVSKLELRFVSKDVPSKPCHMR